MDDRLRAARARLKIRIEASRDGRFADQAAAYRLGHLLTRRGFTSVSVVLVGSDEGEAQQRRKALRAV
jgi:hypothetical protein